MQKTIRQCWQHRAVFALLSLDGRSAATSFCGFSRWQPQRARHKQNDTNQILQVLNTESFQENSKHQIASFNRHKKDECSACKESGVVVKGRHHVHALLSRVFESSAGVLVICHRQCATPSSLHRTMKTKHCTKHHSSNRVSMVGGLIWYSRVLPTEHKGNTPRRDVALLTGGWH